MALSPCALGGNDKRAQGWYIPSTDVRSSLLEDAFEEAKLKFSSTLSQDQQKIAFVNSKNNLEEVQEVVAKSMEKYESGKTGSKSRKWLESFSRRVKFYGDILDVFVQHHPEYVSLVWGAIKFLFTGVINHEKTISKLAEALSNIADSLPRVELAANLYPTERMQTAVAELSAYILRFLVRAHDWYQEGPWKHVIHSITQPSELRYDDLLELIARSSAVIQGLAMSGQQVEFRYMHGKVDEINTKVDTKLDLVNSKLIEISAAMSLQSATMISTNHRLSDLQFSQIMRSISDTAMLDPTKVFHYLTATRRRTYHNPNNVISRRFLNSPKLRRWTSSEQSDISIIKGNFRSRRALRNFCVEVIEQLRASEVPILLAMNIPQTECSTSNISPIDLLKYLIRQALQFRHSSPTEKSMSLNCAPFHCKLSEAEWFQLLESALADIGRQVYLVVDLELLDRDFGPFDGFPWLSAFLGFFSKLSDRRISHHVKVLLISYGAELPFALSSSEYSEFVIHAKTDVVTAHQRRAGRNGAARHPDQFRLGDANSSRTRLRSSRRGI